MPHVWEDPNGSYERPIYVVEKHYGLLWFIGFILKWMILVVFWMVMLIGFVVVYLPYLIIDERGRRKRAQADTRRQSYNISDRR